VELEKSIIGGSCPVQPPKFRPARDTIGCIAQIRGCCRLGNDHDRACNGIEEHQPRERFCSPRLFASAFVNTLNDKFPQVCYQSRVFLQSCTVAQSGYYEVGVGLNAHHGSRAEILACSFEAHTRVLGIALGSHVIVTDCFIASPVCQSLSRPPLYFTAPDCYRLHPVICATG